jgi:hypothetical protein
MPTAATAIASSVRRTIRARGVLDMGLPPILGSYGRVIMTAISARVMHRRTSRETVRTPGIAVPAGFAVAV